MKGYKAFEKGMICRGKQYAENMVFEEETAEVCRSGMHFCKNPLDVLDYYPLVDVDGNMTEFAEVEALDECKTYDNKKFCTKKLKIGAKLSFPALVKAGVDFELEKVPAETFEKCSSGDCAQISSSGDYAQISSSGNYAQIGSSGNYAQIGSSGYDAQIGSSGNNARIGISGDSAQIGSSGNDARISSSGNYTRISNSGYDARIGISGDSARIGSSGDGARITSSGKHSVVCCAGNFSIVKAKKGSWITLSEWKYNESENVYIPVCVKTEFVDGERIKENTFYKLTNGKFVEVK